MSLETGVTWYKTNLWIMTGIRHRCRCLLMRHLEMEEKLYSGSSRVKDKLGVLLKNKMLGTPQDMRAWILSTVFFFIPLLHDKIEIFPLT